MYAGGSVVTSDGIANIVLEYASELARVETSATLDVPTIAEDGTLHSAQLLLGPASQLIAVDAEDSEALTGAISGADEVSFVAEVELLIVGLRPHPMPVTDVDLSAADPYDN